LVYIEDGDHMAEILSKQQYPSLRNFSFKFESNQGQPTQIQSDHSYPSPPKKQIIQHITPQHVPVSHQNLMYRSRRIERNEDS